MSPEHLYTYSVITTLFLVITLVMYATQRQEIRDLNKYLDFYRKLVDKKRDELRVEKNHCYAMSKRIKIISEMIDDSYFDLEEKRRKHQAIEEEYKDS
jgi:hypothetical protein